MYIFLDILYTYIQHCVIKQDFTFNRFFMKLFKTSNMETVNCCQKLFGCDLPSALLKQRFEKFIATV